MIKIRLDRVMVDNHISLKQLALDIGMSEVNLSRLKNGHVREIKLETLNKLCKYLHCQPRDFLEYQHDLD